MNMTGLKNKTAPACFLLLGIFVHRNGLCREYMNALPPPQALQSEFVPEYHVSVILNGRKLDCRVPIRATDGHYLVPRVYLNHKIPVPANQLPAGNSQYVDITAISAMKSRYDTGQHALVIDIPAEWMPEQMRSAAQTADNIGYNRASGFALDYDAYLSHNRWVDAGSLYLGGRLFTGSGYLFASGMANRAKLRDRVFSDTQYIRYQTYYRQYFADSDTALILGDFISDGGEWDSGVRMGGISFRKAYQLSPDKNIYQSPSIRGTARTPSIVDIFMDNRKIASDSVDSGPYQINNLPFINGAGQVTVVTTDKLGNKTNETVQLYKTSSLLAAGINQFSANLGYLRYDYGYRDSKYRNLAFSGYLSRGITPTLTHVLFLQNASRLVMAGTGINFLVAPVGTFSLIGAASSDNEFARRNGGKAELGYSYTNQYVNISYNHSQYSRGYTDLGSYGYRIDGFSLMPTRSVDQVWLSYQWRNAVTLGVGYFYIHPYVDAAYSMGNISLSVPTFLQGDLSLGVSAYNARGHDLMTMVNWSVPLGNSARAQYTFNHSSIGNRNDVNLSWGRYGPQQTHIDLQASKEETGYRYQRASVYHSSRYTSLSGGLYGSNDKTYWMEGSGTVTLLDGAVQFNRESQGAFVLVNAGIPDLPYYSGGNLEGRTDSRGFGFIDNVQAGIPIEISLDPTHLPAEYRARRYRQKVRLYPRSGTEVNFGGEKAFPASFRLTDGTGHPLPAGSIVTDENTGNSSFIGYHGNSFMYLENDHPVMLSIYRGEGSTCRVVLHRQDFISLAGTLPTYTCR